MLHKIKHRTNLQKLGTFWVALVERYKEGNCFVNKANIHSSSGRWQVKLPDSLRQ